MSAREVYTLTVYTDSTKPYVVENANPGSCTYRVNWDMIFNDRNKFYKNCLVRCRMSGKSGMAHVISAAFNKIQGRLSVQGLAYNKQYAPDTPGLVLALLEYSEGSYIEGGINEGFYYNVNTLKNAVAPQCECPQGISEIVVQLIDQNGVIGYAYAGEFALTLEFELTDPIETVKPITKNKGLMYNVVS